MLEDGQFPLISIEDARALWDRMLYRRTRAVVPFQFGSLFCVISILQIFWDLLFMEKLITKQKHSKASLGFSKIHKVEIKLNIKKVGKRGFNRK